MASPKHYLLSALLAGSFSLGGCQLFLNLSPDLLVEDNPERCADGADNDGDGLVDCGDPECRPFCTSCGNGAVDPGEDCDDGNEVEGDGCDSNCTLSACENGISAPGEICFTQSFALEAGLFPFAITVADLNRDEIPDIAVANFDSDDISLFLGKGGGEFAAANSFPTGGFAPSDLVVEDFNQDGLLDIAVANFDSDNTSIFLGDGEGSLKDPRIFFTDSTPVAVVSGDFNQDGLLDLAFAKNASTFVSLLFGEGDGFFKKPNFIEVGSNPSDLIKGDFNQDDRLDLVVTHEGSHETLALLGDGKGGFAVGGSLSSDVGEVPLALASEDFNQDGFPDLAVAYFGSDMLGIFLNKGGSGSELPLEIPVEDEPLSLDTGDFNQDGIPDLVVVYAKSTFVQLFLGKGDGNFKDPETLPIDTEGETGAVKVADINQDGLLDILVTIPSLSKVLVIPATP